MDQEQHFAFIREEANHEIARLKTLLRDSRVTEEERGVTLAMLEFYENLRISEDGPSVQLAEKDIVPSRTKSVPAEARSPHKEKGFSAQKDQAA